MKLLVRWRSGASTRYKLTTQRRRRDEEKEQQQREDRTGQREEWQSNQDWQQERHQDSSRDQDWSWDDGYNGYCPYYYPKGIRKGKWKYGGGKTLNLNPDRMQVAVADLQEQLLAGRHARMALEPLQPERTS